MPEMIPINANVHFKCAFDIDVSQVLKPMTHLRQLMRNWCARKVGGSDQVLHRAWFYRGNNPKVEPAQYHVNGHQIRTIVAPSDDPEEPNCWGIEVIHSDSEIANRRWAAEATLKRSETGDLRFTTVIKHWMTPYYIGEYPEPPSASAPGYIRSILTDNDLTCRRGDAVLENEAVWITQKMVFPVFKALTSAERQVPFVMVAAHASRGLLIDPARLASALRGNANVFVLPAVGVVEEMNYHIGEHFNCEPGSVRAYLPYLDRNLPANARSHRYLSTTFIDDNGEDEIIHFLANGLSRNGRNFRPDDLTSFDDIFSERRKHALRQLAGDRTRSLEETEMVWEENEKLSKEASTWESLAIQHESENEELQREVSGLKYRIEEADRVRSRISDLESQLNGLTQLATLPLNLADILDCISKLFPKRIVCTDLAKAAALRYSTEHDNYWSKPDQLSTAWGMMFVLATQLYDLVFVEKAHDLEAAFQGRSVFELAMSEGRQTKKDADLMRLRQISHNGSDFDITPHLKYGNRKPKLLRLHFAIDRQESLLIAGHFGDHMENYSTQKL